MRRLNRDENVFFYVESLIIILGNILKKYSLNIRINIISGLFTVREEWFELNISLFPRPKGKLKNYYFIKTYNKILLLFGQFVLTRLTLLQQLTFHKK